MQLSSSPLVSGNVPNIIDIEASGFSSHSYPIEVGVVTSDGSRYCRLIKPYKEWQHWDKAAESVHGITRDVLKQHGYDGRQVCLELNKLYAQQTLYSDGWSVDYPWLIALFSQAQVEMAFKVSSIELLLRESDLMQWKAVKQQVEVSLQMQRHRASNDAEVIQKTYLTLTGQVA